MHFTVSFRMWSDFRVELMTRKSHVDDNNNNTFPHHSCVMRFPLSILSATTIDNINIIIKLIVLPRAPQHCWYGTGSRRVPIIMQVHAIVIVQQHEYCGIYEEKKPEYFGQGLLLFFRYHSNYLSNEHNRTKAALLVSHQETTHVITTARHA